MAGVGLNSVLLSRLARCGIVSSSLACAINRISVQRAPRISRSWLYLHTGVASAKVSQSTQEAIHATSEDSNSSELTEVTETREEYIQRVRTDTRAKIDYDDLYERLHLFLSLHKPVKATEVNMICYNTNNLQDLQRVKRLLHLFRCSPSVQRLSVANVAIATCLRLGVPEEALDLISDPVKYGVFPSPFTTNKLMLEFANRGDVDSVNRLCQFKRSVDMEPGFYELQYIIRARAVAMLDKYDENMARERSAEDEATPTQSSSDGETTPTQSLDNEVLDSQEKKEDQEVTVSDSADVATPTVSDLADAATPTESSDQPSDAGNAHDIMKEELDRILELCGDNLEQHRGPAGYYCVHQKLMEKELDSLAEYVLHKVENEKRPEKVSLHLWLNHYRMRSKHADVVDVLKKLVASNKTLEWEQLQVLQAFFKDCSDQGLRETVQQMKLEEMTDPPPPKWPAVPSYQY